MINNFYGDYIDLWYNLEDFKLPSYNIEIRVYFERCIDSIEVVGCGVIDNPISGFIGDDLITDHIMKDKLFIDYCIDEIDKGGC